MTARRIPLNLFGMGFGLAGLATSWQIAADFDVAPGWIADVLVIIATLVWAASVVLYASYVLRSRGAFSRDLHDMTVGPFASLAIITPVLLAADGIAPRSRDAATIVIDVLIVLIVALGGWFTGTWMRGGTELDRLHPGYFLPTVAGGLVASAGAAEVGQDRLSEALFGIGIICWVIVGSMILGRLIFRPALPDALVPTMAIEVAPAAVASLALFFASDGRVTLPIIILAGYGILMVAAQLPLIPRYLSLSFSLSTWAFTFSWAAVASTALFWIADGDPAGGRAWSWVVLAAITVLIGGIALRTIVAVARGNLLPPAAPVTTVPADRELAPDRPLEPQLTGGGANHAPHA